MNLRSLLRAVILSCLPAIAGMLLLPTASGEAQAPGGLFGRGQDLSEALSDPLEILGRYPCLFVAAPPALSEGSLAAALARRFQAEFPGIDGKASPYGEPRLLFATATKRIFRVPLRTELILDGEGLRPRARGPLLECLGALAQAPEILWVEPVMEAFFLMLEPDDPYFSSTGSWGQAYLDLWGLHTIGAVDAWEITTGDPDLLVAVVDTGADYNHPELRDRIWINPNGEVPDADGDGVITFADIDADGDGAITPGEIAAASNGIDEDGNGHVDDLLGWDLFGSVSGINISPDNDPRDGHGHGTHVAGTIGAAANNGLGVCGVNWQSRILIAKGFSDSGGATTETLAGAIVYAVENGARIINNSWGGIEPSNLIEAAIDFAYENGTALVFASGNFGIDSRFLFPTNHHRTITVNASNYADTIAPFSDYGTKSDVAAPGGGQTLDRLETYTILAPLAANSYFAQHLSEYVMADGLHIRLGGTSMAAPHAVGVLSLGLSVLPDASVEEARQLLRFGADDRGDPGWDPFFGHGRVSALGTLLVEEPLECHISAPANGANRAFFSDPSAIEIRGSSHSRFDPQTSYRLEVGSGRVPAEWTPITAWIAAQVEEGVLAAWDATGLLPGDYTLRLLTADSTGRTFEDRILFTVSLPFVSAGWPKEVEGTNAFNSPKVADLDLDGKDEIIVASEETLYVLDENAQPLAGWPRTLESLLGPEDVIDTAYGFLGDVAIGDFDPGHAGLEIITVVGTKSLQGTRHSTVQVLHADGSALDNGAWPYRVPEVPLDPLRDLQAATLADIDLDGALDLIVYLHKKLHILNFAGDNIANAFLQGYGFQVTSGGKLIAAGELDGDPLPELVHGEFDLALDESSLYVWDLEDVEPGLLIEMGDLMAGLQEDPPDLYRLEHLTLADLDEDPQLELVLLLANKMQVDPWSYKTRDYTLVGLNSHGNGEWSLAGGEWPVLLDETGTIALFPDSMVFVVPADLDLDGAPELIASTRNTINIRRADGSPYLDHALPGMVFESSPVVADISGGGFHPEIIANSLFSSIFAWDHLGSAIGGFPMATINPIIGAPAVGDVDGDGDKEVVVRDVPLMPFFGDPSWIYVFDGGGSGPDPWPMVRGCPEATNAQPVPSTPAPERGDANEDGEIDIGDVAFLATFLFLAGPAPSDLDLLDTNSDTQIDIADIVFLLAYLFNGGPAPAP